MNAVGATSMSAALLVLVGCTPAAQPSLAVTTSSPVGADSIAGTYNCGLEGGEPEDVVVLDADGTVTITPPVGEVGTGTWTVDGGAGAFTIDGQEDPFTIEGENLVFADPGAADRFVCVPES